MFRKKFMKEKLKGRKVYAISNSKKDSSIICCNISLDKAKCSLDSNWNILVEMTVTRVFIREADLKEIETEL